MPNIIGGKYKKTTLDVPSKMVRPTSAFKREAIFSILAIRDQVAPPTINLDNLDAETAMNLCANSKVEANINIALSNSFGFGGTNACLLMGKIN